MLKRIYNVFLSVFLASLLIGFSISSTWAYEAITAAKAYEMVKQNQAILIDIRTLEECYWVGSPALEPNGMPIAYILPWKLWPSNMITAKDDYYKPSMIVAKETFRMVFETYLPDKTTPIILFCRSGDRADVAAKYLESLGYSNVYSIDNYLLHAEGKFGMGGFQGKPTNSPTEYAGYRGWPGRVSYLPTYPNYNPNWLPDDPGESVSWMDFGLPVTQKLDPNKIIYYYLGLVYTK